ncbi:MAG: hypothetical protein AAFW47_01170 [Pseudomonadota bacterium]
MAVLAQNAATSFALPEASDLLSAEELVRFFEAPRDFILEADSGVTGISDLVRTLIVSDYRTAEQITEILGSLNSSQNAQVGAGFAQAVLEWTAASQEVSEILQTEVVEAENQAFEIAFASATGNEATSEVGTASDGEGVVGSAGNIATSFATTTDPANTPTPAFGPAGSPVPQLAFTPSFTPSLNNPTFDDDATFAAVTTPGAGDSDDGGVPGGGGGAGSVSPSSL